MPLFNVNITVIKLVYKHEQAFMTRLDDRHCVNDVIRKVDGFNLIYHLEIGFNDFGELEFYFDMYQDFEKVNQPFSSAGRNMEYVIVHDAIGLTFAVEISLVDNSKWDYHFTNRIGFWHCIPDYVKEARRAKRNSINGYCLQDELNNRWFETKTIIYLRYVD
jgi:hypothetical protein